MDDARDRALGVFADLCACNMEVLAGTLRLVAREAPDVIDAALHDLQEHGEAGRRVQESLEVRLNADVWDEFLDEHPELR